MITIYINNEEKSVAENTSLTTLLNSIENLPLSGYAVAVNSNVVAKDKRDSFILSHHDKVMIIKAFYGG